MDVTQIAKSINLKGCPQFCVCICIYDTIGQSVKIEFDSILTDWPMVFDFRWCLHQLLCKLSQSEIVMHSSLQIHTVPEDVGYIGTMWILNGEDLVGVWHEPPGNGKLWENIHWHWWEKWHLSPLHKGSRSWTELGNPALHCSTVRTYNHAIFDSLSLQNKTSHQHMIKYQNAKRRSRGQREYERIVKVRLTRVHLNMY